MPLGAELLGSFVATLYRNNPNNTTPGLNHDNEDLFYFGGTISPYSWISNDSFTECDFSAAIDVEPGAGNLWTFEADFATLAPNQTCADVTSWMSTPLCVVNGLERSCRADAVAMKLTGPFCLRGRGKGTKTAATFNSRSGGSASFHCRNPGTSGIMHFQGSGNTAVSTQFFAGNVFRGTNFDRPYWISPGTALDACSGAVALATPPGSGGTWHIRIATSTTPLGPDQNCSDLSYAQTADACTITGSNKECHFSPVPSPVPAGGCLQLRGNCTGTCAATTSAPSYGLDCRTSSTGGFSSGGLTYETAGSGAFDNCAHCFNTGPWAISDLAAAPSATLGQQYWVAPRTGLSGCAGAFTFELPPSGAGQYQVGLRASTTGLTSDKGCLDMTYTDTGPLCAMSGANKSCVFPFTSFSIPANGCFALVVTKSSTAPPGASGNEFNWQASCVAN